MKTLTEDWDFYLGHIDGEPASIFVDLGAADAPPMAAYPVMAYLGVTMRKPNASGLSSDEEYNQLILIEQALDKLGKDDEVIYVGRCTSGGLRDFYFYLSDGSSWDAKVRQVMSAFPDHQFQTGIRDDAAWSAYHAFLYPAGTAYQSVQNQRVCRALENHGDPLTDAREIDHWADFPDEPARNAFVEDALKLGFAIRSLSHVDTYDAQLYRSDTPSMSGIDEVTHPLYELAVRHGGQYDGWESIVLSAGD